MTTSLILETLFKVCLVVLSLTLRAGEKIAIGGLALKTLIKEKGLKLGFHLSIVLARAIGLGQQSLINIYYCFVSNSLGSIEIIEFSIL